MSQRACRKCGTIFDDRFCRVCHNILVKKRYIRKRSEILALAAAQHAKHPERKNAQSAQWRKDNPERCKEIAKEWQEKNREKSRALSKKWKANNPEYMRIYNQNRRAKRKKDGGKLSFGLTEKLLKLQKGKCACCHKPLGKKFDRDHIMPLALGGKNDDKNIQLLCEPCNGSKYAKHPIDFMKSRGFLL